MTFAPCRCQPQLHNCLLCSPRGTGPLVWPSEGKHRGKWRHRDHNRKLHQSEGKIDKTFECHLSCQITCSIILSCIKNWLSSCNKMWSSSFNPPGGLAKKVVWLQPLLKTGCVWACRCDESGRSLLALPEAWIPRSGLDHITVNIQLTSAHGRLHTHRWENGWWNTWT